MLLSQMKKNEVASLLCLEVWTRVSSSRRKLKFQHHCHMNMIDNHFANHIQIAEMLKLRFSTLAGEIHEVAFRKSSL
jgi:hypothetical protein